MPASILGKNIGNVIINGVLNVTINKKSFEKQKKNMYSHHCHRRLQGLANMVVKSHNAPLDHSWMQVNSRISTIQTNLLQKWLIKHEK
jgi:fatty acid/phospholipid biosynthesis enzyme